MSSRLGPRLLRLLQAITGGAAVFALLGACGIPINQRQRPPYQRVRPVVVRLSGTWDAVPAGGGSFRPLQMTLRQTGASIGGVLHLADRDLASEWHARIDARGQFRLVFGRPPDYVRIDLRIEGRGQRLAGTLSDGRRRESVLFLRR